MKSAAVARRNRSAFTLIELLTVIAIIAILAAIIFPVFAAVRENARRGACISNMREISSAIKLYELDNRRAPEFLLAPAIRVGSGANSKNGCALDGPATGPGSDKSHLVAAAAGDDVCTLEQAAGTGKLGGLINTQQNDAGGAPTLTAGGLYPEYVRSLNSYHCPNNVEFDAANTTDPAAVAGPLERYNDVSDPVAADVPGKANDKLSFRFYKYDSYDANPSINTTNEQTLTEKLDARPFTTRYAKQWLPTVYDEPDPSTVKPYTDLANAGGADLESYSSQLRWREPGDDTYVTMCSWHAPKGKMVVLFSNGTARVVDVRRVNERAKYTGTGTIASDIATDFDGYKLKP